MTITAIMVKELREKTGVPMMECKKALQESDANVDKAILWLRERGLSRAAKKSGRATAEGVVQVMTSDDHSKAILLELNCETDFASKSDDFQGFSKRVCKYALDNNVSSIEKLLEMSIDGSTTVAAEITAKIAKVGENMQIRRLHTVSGGYIEVYSHMGGKIGTMIQLNKASNDEEKSLAKDIAMHIAASSPRYLKSDEVDASELDTEKDLAKKKLLEQGKPEAMIDKILVGQMNKFYKEICLVDQPFVKDPSLSVSKVVTNLNKELAIDSFKRFGLGEGVEKKVDNFAEEVAQLSKA